jgi:hypothetical protein
VRVHGWGAVHAEGEAVMAATEVPVRAEARRRFRTENVRFGSYECADNGRPRRSRAPRNRGVPRRDVRTEHLASAGVLATLDLWFDARDALNAAIAWQGEDAAGAFVGATRAGALAVEAPEADQGAEPGAGYILRGAGRGGVLLERCREGRTGSGCELLWGANRGVLVKIDAREGLERMTGERATVAGSLPLPDGGMLVLFVTHMSHLTVDLVVVLGPDGQVRARRAFAWKDFEQFRAFARYRGDAGYVVSDARDPLTLRFYPLGRDLGAPPVNLPRLPAGAVSLCRAPRAVDAAEVFLAHFAFGPTVVDTRGQHSTDLRSTLEVGTAGACLRAVEAWVGPLALLVRERWAGDGMRVSAGSDGALAGVADNGEERQGLRCEAR